MVLNLNEESGDSNNVIDDNLPEMLLDCEDDVVEDDNLPGILLDRIHVRIRGTTMSPAMNMSEFQPLELFVFCSVEIGGGKLKLELTPKSLAGKSRRRLLNGNVWQSLMKKFATVGKEEQKASL
ncbi:hypothetical protein LXL04_035196 [Taraxacum kok-saghyz]